MLLWLDEPKVVSGVANFVVRPAVSLDELPLIAIVNLGSRAAGKP
jgi:hypothetical protein